MELLHEPVRPEKDILLAFDGQMPHIMGAFVYGSYARGEHEEGSDVDVMIVADEHAKSIKTPKQLKAKNYDIQIMSKDAAFNAAKRDVLFKEMLKEAKPVLNEKLLQELVAVKTGTGSIATRVDFAKSSLGIMKSLIGLDEEDPFAESAYPLVMRIKEMLMLKCFLDRRKYSFRLLEETLVSHGISRKSFPAIINQYRALHDGKKPAAKRLKRSDALILASILEDLIKYVEKQKAEKGH